MFLVAQLEKLKAARETGEDFPCLFDERNIESAFGIMDPTGRGYITNVQYQEGSSSDHFVMNGNRYSSEHQIPTWKVCNGTKCAIFICRLVEFIFFVHNIFISHTVQ